jgi:F-type H+-transporting ATPase subunit epsilon
MNVEIITPDTTLFKGEAILVQLPGAEGSFEVLQHHAPLIAILQQGRSNCSIQRRTSVSSTLKGV